MAMELFTKKGGKMVEPAITISKAGQIGLNSACMTKYIKSREYVMLYGDMENKKIGIKPIEKYEVNAFKISLSQKKTSGAISGHSFLTYLGIGYKKIENTKYVPEWDEKGQMLVIKVE